MPELASFVINERLPLWLEALAIPASLYNAIKSLDIELGLKATPCWLLNNGAFRLKHLQSCSILSIYYQ